MLMCKNKTFNKIFFFSLIFFIISFFSHIMISFAATDRSTHQERSKQIKIRECEYEPSSQQHPNTGQPFANANTSPGCVFIWLCLLCLYHVVCYTARPLAPRAGPVPGRSSARIQPFLIAGGPLVD